jgi:hypothetical protein
MFTHEVDIYHCQKCGRIENREHGAERPPECCGESMALAVAGIRYQDPCESVGSTDEVIDRSHRPCPAPQCSCRQGADHAGRHPRPAAKQLLREHNG